MLIYATQFCLVRHQIGESVATLSVDTQPARAAVGDKLDGAYDCPHWDEAGAAQVVFGVYGSSQPLGIVGAEVLSIFHDGYRRFEVLGFVPDLPNMGDATFDGLVNEFCKRSLCLEFVAHSVHRHVA